MWASWMILIPVPPPKRDWRGKLNVYQLSSSGEKGGALDSFF